MTFAGVLAALVAAQPLVPDLISLLPRRPDAARALTRLYARAAEAAALAAREESDRHLLDAPERQNTP